ncbi:MAG: penicillin-binding transpeptidase domain-containing protein [Frankiaceae bacterium]
MAAVLVVALVLGVGGYVLVGRGGDRGRGGTVDAFLAAWARNDPAAMSALVDNPPADFARQVSDYTGALRVSSARFQRVDETGYRAELQVAGVAPFAYSGEVPLVRRGDAWRVVWSPSVLHPALRPGLHVELASSAGQRARLIAADGRPLRGLDADIDSNLLGTVGKLTPAQAQAAGPRYEAGAVSGQTGLERAYNDQLDGTPGYTVTLVDSSGRPQSVLLATSPTAGANVATTIDLRVQKAAEAALTPLAKPGALVALNTRTGGVLALANNPASGLSRALRGTYPPGSTFKIVTATAGLMNGRTPDTVLNCPSSVNAYGLVIRNAEKEQLGPISFATAFAHSCNTAFINLELSLPKGSVTRAAQLFGFDGSQPLPIASVGGSFPPPGDAAEGAAAAIGQAKVIASPLQMASVVAGVAAGEWRRPFVVGGPDLTHPLPPDVAANLRSFMAGVVQNGTAAGAGLPPGTYGKTGTAEFGNDDPPQTHAWFVGFRGDVAFAVVVDGGGFGGEVAAPVAARFLRLLG